MPLNNDTAPTESRLAFCRSLKAARERKGITLAQISATTKIPASLFEEFERDDLHRWPKALFRRSFFRDYVRAIGEPLAETCADFARLFPDEEYPDPLTSAVTPGQNTPDNDSRIAFDAAAWQESLAPLRTAITSVWNRVTAAFARVSEPADDTAPESDDDAKSRAWVTDARRVEGTRPRLRVRIKLPQ
jgi:cytoskeletal protein RodZ